MKNFINKIGIIFFMALVLGVLGCVDGYAATVGQRILQPEQGWKRADGGDNFFIRQGDWTICQDYGTGRGYYKDKVDRGGQYSGVKFQFVGTKVRIIGVGGETPTTYPSKVHIIIDNNIDEYFTCQYGVNGGKDFGGYIVYEKKDLENKLHTVTIWNSENSIFYFDAVDIDTTGEFKIYDENVNIKLSLNKSSLDLNIGQSEILKATITPNNTTNKKIVWESKNPNVVTVDQTGKVTAVTSGSAIIVAKIEGTDITASCTVNVNNVPEVLSGRAILNATMTNGTIKEYDLSMTEINDFINWYNGRAEGKGTISYCIKKNANIKPFNNRKEYLVFDKIYSFEVNEYDNK